MVLVVPCLFLILIGCASHEPVVLDHYTPEKHITNSAGHLYTEIVTNVTPVSSNSISHGFTRRRPISRSS